MHTQRDLYAELKAVAAQPDTADALLEVIAQLGDLADADERSDFSSLLHVIQENTTFCAKALLMWFADPPKKHAAKALLSSISVAYLQADAHAEIVFPKTTPSAAVLAGCRMNACFVSPAYALGWVLSLLRSWPDDATAMKGADTLLHYLTSEFPGTLNKLFKEIQPERFPSRASEIISHYKMQIDDERRQLDSYPFLKEFAMLPEERDVVRTLERQFQKNVLRGAEEKSIFLRFVKHRKFKYARTVSIGAATQLGEGESVIEMKQYSVETELPESEWRDPMLGIRVRNDLWEGILE